MRSSRDIDRTILELASRSASVVHARDLRSAGIGRTAVATRVQHAWMAPLLRETYAVGPLCRTPTFEMRCAAGVLAGGEGAGLDHETAARARDVWNRRVTRIHVTTPSPPRGGGADAYVFHRAPAGWSVDELVPSRFGALVPFVDMCVHLARTMTKWQLAFIIDRGRYLRLVTIAALEAAVIDHRRNPWITVLRDAIDLIRSGSVGTRGFSEDHLLDGLLSAGVDDPTVNTRGALGMSRDEPDFVWLPERLNVEVDGGSHDLEAQARDDELRDEEARQRGFRVMRVSDRAVRHERRAVVAHVVRALAGEPVDLDRFRRRRTST